MNKNIPSIPIPKDASPDMKQFCQNVNKYLSNLVQDLSGFFGTGSKNGNGNDCLILQPNGGNVKITSLTVYANNAAAITGGLTAGDLYRNGANPDIVCTVH